MNTAEMLALAVLRGDFTATRPLIDLLLEQYSQGAIEVPVKRLTVDVKRLRVVLYWDDDFELTELEVERIRHDVNSWLNGDIQTLIVPHPFARVDLYEFLPKEDKK